MAKSQAVGLSVCLSICVWPLNGRLRRGHIINHSVLLRLRLRFLSELIFVAYNYFRQLSAQYSPSGSGRVSYWDMSCRRNQRSRRLRRCRPRHRRLERFSAFPLASNTTGIGRRELKCHLFLKRRASFRQETTRARYPTIKFPLRKECVNVVWGVLKEDLRLTTILSLFHLRPKIRT